MSLPRSAGGGGQPTGWRAGGKEAKFWYIGSKFMQERAKFANLKWDRELKRRLEQLASDERSRLYDLQQEIYSVRAIYRAQKLERWSSRLSAELADSDQAAADASAHATQVLPLGSWIDDASVAPVTPAAHQRLRKSASSESHSSFSSSSTPPPATPPLMRRQSPSSPQQKQLAPDDGSGPREAAVSTTAAMAVGSVRLALQTKGGFVYHPIQRPRSLRETSSSNGSNSGTVVVKVNKKQPNSQELLATLLGEKFASETAIRERIARRHKVNFAADEYTDGAMAYAKRQLSIKKSKLFSDNAKTLIAGKDEGEGKSEDASFRLDERKLKQLQVAQQQLSYDKSLSRVESFLGVATSSTSRRSSHPALSERDVKVISLLKAAAAK